MEDYRLKQLKPCPFCGGVNVESGNSFECGDGYVHCYGCGGHMTIMDGNNKEERVAEAIRRWNRREG